MNIMGLVASFHELHEMLAPNLSKDLTLMHLGVSLPEFPLALALDRRARHRLSGIIFFILSM